ncbi:MAG: amino acid adenylation domain-containing protein [Blastocatellia bacterium]
MIRHYERLLESIAEDADKKISKLEMLSEAEKNQILVEWIQTATEYPSEQLMHELFEQQVERAPQAKAAGCQDKDLTYEELNMCANRLAHYLLERGAGPESVIGIAMHRSLDFLTSVIACFKTGAAYLPLDPLDPPHRLSLILDDSNPLLVLSDDALLGGLDRGRHRLVFFDAIACEIHSRPCTNLPLRARPDNLAYLIYTSGSTGKPKGAMIHQRGMLNHLYAKIVDLAISGDDTIAQNASQCFDISIWQMLAGLLVGASVQIIPSQESRDPEKLVEQVSKRRVTILEVVPAMLRAIIESLKERGSEGGSEMSELRWLVATGEALEASLCTQWLRLRPRVKIINAYGPTECSDDVTHEVIQAPPAEGVRYASIGRPVANTIIYILGKDQTVVPVGVAGEICVAGEGVGRGYLGESARTAEVFVADKFSGGFGRRLYRTGDIGKWRSDGRIDYLGRKDEQVKIRGFRIELAEIECSLGQHPQVKECAVVLGQALNEDKSLLAYVVPYQQGAAKAGDLRAFLKQTLPEYMIPSAFVMIEHLPLTSNGKLDRKSLPGPTQSRDDLGSGYVAPRSLVEQAMTEIWSQVLQVEQVGVHDNFFELGGHSLLATQLLSRLRHMLKVEVSLRKLFEFPTVAELGQVIEKDLQSGQGQEISTIQRASREGPLPLSFAQERLWFLDQFEPGSSFYSIPMALRLIGPLDVDALQWALDEVVRRHESLRTVFASSNGRPFQRILERGSLEIQVTELGEIAEPELGMRVQQIVIREARQAFNLERGPLIRVSLIRLSGQEHVLVVVMHHIISDGWSMGLLVKEVASLYRSYRTGERPELEEPPVQYADYALWQREWLQGEVLERQLTYWRQELDGHRAVLELPSDRPRPAIQSYRGARERQEIPAEVMADLMRMTREEGATLFMLLLAAFQVLLYRYSAQEDISVGTPIAGRNRFETESLVGLFVNTLVMRVDLSGEPSFRELVGRVREVVIGAFTNQDVPFEKLVEELNPERSMSHSPLFQVMFTLQNAEIEMPQLPDLRLDVLACDTATSKFDLSLDVYEGQRGLVCTFEYNTDLFDASTIKRFASHFRTLLEGISADPNRRISDLVLLNESEQHQLISGWNDTEKDYAHGRCVNELFEAHAESNPDDVAAAFHHLTITYGELNRRSNQVAHFLRQLGVGPDVPVGIYLECSIDVLVAVFGILKAGGAYVPLDAAYPKERLALLVEDSGLTTVVTQSRLSAQLPPFVRHVVRLDRDWEAISGYSPESPPLVASPDNLAYVVYTSGSTGKPKGVMISHRSLVNAFQAWQESYRLGSDCKSHLQMASFSFDVFAGDLVRALCSGGTLILCPRELLLEPEKLYELMLRERVDAAEFVPAVVRQLVGYVAERGLSFDFMKLLVVGSDTWNVWEFEQLKSYCGDTTRVINSYGVSEAAVDSCYFESTQIQLSPGGLVPLGRPFGNTHLHVLDPKLRPAPVGVAGELFIGGLGLARGYLNQPELTAERFVANPFNELGGSRLYRTGDCARRLADGTVEFLGRLDNQVKIRGFRIELGEIETALSEHPAVREAVVAASEARQGNRILVAYTVAHIGQSIRTAELRSFLKERLPEHMIPSVFVEMERMPLSPNGKLDRRALPAPGAARPDLEQTFVGPRNYIEETLNAIWIEVLKIDRVGINDNFFDLGGHSLLATQMISRLRKQFDIELPLRSLFENPTIAELGESVDAVIRGGRHGEIKPITPAPKDKPLQLSFAQERLWFLNRLQPGNPFYNSPAAVRLFGRLDVQALEKSLAEIVRRHEVLRTTFPTVDGAPALLISPPQPLSLPVIDIGRVPVGERETRARLLINEEVMRHFDLENGPLLRAVLLRLAEQDHVLIFTTHHIVSDAWSMDVLVREAVTLYEAFSNNRPSPLADLTVQYTDFTAWQREWMRGEVLNSHLDYWKQQLSGAPARLQLPTDRPRSSAQNYRGNRLTLPLSRSLLDPLKELTRRSGATLFMGLLAAFQTLLYRYTCQDDIVVGTAIAGRGRAETEGLIGFFINMLVMRADLSGAPRFLDVLSRVRETALGAYAHQDLPFEKLVDALQPRRDPGVSPLFQVAFGLQNTPAPHVQLPGLEVRPVGFEEQAVRYDLTLWVWELTDGLTAAWTYSTDLFNESTIIRMHQHYDALLLNIVADPEERVNALEMLTEAEREQKAIDERESHDLKLESLMTSKRTAIGITSERA